jgi:hypothetical protein
MLARLADLLRNVGRLSGLVIDERDDMPSSSAYRSRFGSLLRAYQLVGYAPARDYDYLAVNRELRAMHPQIVSETVAAISQQGGTVSVDPTNDLLTVNHEFTASIVISRCIPLLSGARRWNIRIDASLRPDITVAIRMDQDNRAALDYYLLPRSNLRPGFLRLRDENGLSLDGFRYESLDTLFYLASRMPLRRTA